ncbi:MAG: hypothetical protein LH624_11160, partial [Cryobacterium sp.]|nr:hypothetical protein [Cryobacterium sp.]
MNDMFAAQSDASSPSNSTMTSSINETFLLELLYLRSTWNLRVAGHLPRLSPDPASLSSTIPVEDKEWLETSWSHWWDLGISWLSRSDSRRAKLLLLDYRPSPEALLEVLPPRWSEA